MHLKSVVHGFAVALTLIDTAVGVPEPKKNHVPAPSYSAQCYTTLVSRPPKYPQTTWSTYTTSCHSTKTVTVTKTPKAYTTTTVETSTTTSTAPSSVSTATTTEVTTNTGTTSTIQTTTSTTTVSAVSTSTVPTTALFEPISVSDPGVTYDQSPPSKKRRRRSGIDLISPLLHGMSPAPAIHQGAGNVCCYKYIGQCSTTTKTVTTRAPKATITRTLITTTTVVTTPGAVTTTTTTSTTNTLTTTTQTSTTVSTETVYTSTSTAYDACETSNIGRYYDNNLIVDYSTTGLIQGMVTTATNVVDCCISSFQNPIGGIWFWLSNTCIIGVPADGSCALGQASEGIGNSVFTTNQLTEPLVVGNGNCGKWTLGGAE